MQASFPTLPGDLAAAIPPPPAPAPTEAPATEPAAAASADADPEVTAVRAVLATFIDDAQKGDVDAAKAISVIEPGAEDFFTQFTAVLTASKKFTDALTEKFPDQAQR